MLHCYKTVHLEKNNVHAMSVSSLWVSSNIDLE